MSPGVRIVQITDTHIPARTGDRTVLEQLADITMPDPYENLRVVIDHAAATTPDLVVASGDLADRGEPEAYRRLRELFSRFDCPVYTLPGNHDLADELAAHLPGDNVVRVPAVSIEGWTMVFADSGNTEWGELTGERRAEVEQALTDSDDAHVWLWIHHPPAVAGVRNGPGAELLHEDLDGLLPGDPPIRGVGSGHVHVASAAEHGGVPVYTSASTFLGAPAPGYRWYELGHDGSATTDVVGFPQLRDMTEEKVTKLRAAMVVRHGTQAPPARGMEEHFRHEVLGWQRDSIEWRVRAR